jgi:lysophospholipase L1-like esterase
MAVAAVVGTLVVALSVAAAIPSHAGALGASSASAPPTPTLVPVAQPATTDDPGPAGGDVVVRAVTSGMTVRTDPARAVAPACDTSAQPATGPTTRPAERTAGTAVSGGRRAALPMLPEGSAGKRVRAVILGDSFTTGWNGAGMGRAGWLAIASRELGWRSRNLAVAGTGFVNPGWTGQPVRTRIGVAVSARPWVVVLAAGHNDGRYGARTSGRAAAAVIERLRRELPDALLVVVGPIWHTGSPPASILGLRDRVRREAASVGAVFVDPIRDRWFAGAAHRYIGADGLHPTDAGHRHMARLFLAALRRATSEPLVSTVAVVPGPARPGGAASAAVPSAVVPGPVRPTTVDVDGGCAR